MMTELEGLPVADRVERALEDLKAGRRSEEALWLTISARRLRAAGLPVPSSGLEPEPELALYALLGGHADDPYYRFNALCQELDSFVSALEHRRRRQDTRAELRQR